MGSGGGGGGNPALLTQNAAPMGGLPIAGKDSNIGDPFNYGKFQNFLPDVPADGSAMPLAHGLTANMFQYRSPNGTVASGGGGNTGNTLAANSGGSSSNNVDPGASGGNQLPGDPSVNNQGNSQLRDALTALMANGGSGANASNNYAAGPLLQAKNISPSYQNFRVGDSTTASA
jgi:hypothetical protein